MHCGPGPFSMAGPDMVSSMLRSAGFDRIAFQRFDADICVGKDLHEAVEFAMSLGPAGEIIRLAGEEERKAQGRRRHGAARDARTIFAKRRRVGSISTWFVTARNP